jgi:hypothetical protein
LLNRAARFFPILRELKRHLPKGGTLLEVGSGSIGVGEFWKGSFVGCDVNFSGRPVKHMRAVLCSGHQLPFKNGAFDAMVVSDVMEHVPPALRQCVVNETLRVARKVVVFGYPCGPKAFAVDEELYQRYKQRNLAAPVWLEEHMLYPFPDESLFSELPAGWARRVIPNETLEFHAWLMRTEMFRPWDYSFRLLLRIMPRLVERFLDRANSEPSYRKIFVLTREAQPAYA